MTMAKKLIDRDEDTVIVLMFRDPRGIVASRFRVGYVSRNSKRNKTREAEMVCKRMTEDYKTYVDMSVEDNYDGRVVMVKYEDTVTDPMKVARAIYTGLLQKNVPAEVTSWFSSSTTGGKDNGLMGTVRKNGTDTALKWTKQLSRADINSMTAVCRTILEKLKYPIDV